MRITVLRGGPSAEREISLASGAAVAEALRRSGHEVFEADVGPDNLAALDSPADVIFPVLHGTFGEDGQLQKLLEKRRLCFVGSGANASALAMDKIAAKQRVCELGYCTPEYEVWEPLTAAPVAARPAALASAVPALAAAATAAGPVPAIPGAPAALGPRRCNPHGDGAVLESKLKLPLVVKPADQGSSVDTFIIQESADFGGAVRRVVRTFGRALVEEFIKGDELTVGILGGEALPPICVRPKQSFYDFAAKYEREDTEYLFDAGHPRALLARVQEQSRRVFSALGCRHLGRVDWIADADGQLWFLEVNSIPGFTVHSLVPKAAAKIGIPFDELVERLVQMALKA